MRRTVGEAVLPPGVDHHIEHFAGLNQFVCKAPGILGVHVIVERAMNQQQALAAINDALRKTLEKDNFSVTMDTDLVEEKIVDSLDGMVFLLELSGCTDIKFPETDLVQLGFFKVKKLVEFLTEPSA